MGTDWADVIKVGGGFASGVTFMFAKEAIHHFFERRRDRQLALYSDHAETRRASYAKQREVINAILPMVDAAMRAALKAGCWPTVPSEKLVQDAKSTATVLSDFYEGNKFYLSDPLCGPLDKMIHNLSFSALRRWRILQIKKHRPESSDFSEEERAELIELRGMYSEAEVFRIHFESECKRALSV